MYKDRIKKYLLNFDELSNDPKEKYRNVMVFQLEPVISKETSILNTHKTRLSYYEDVHLSPSIIGQRKLVSGYF